MDIRLGQIQPRRSRAKRRQFPVRASTPPGAPEKRPHYHLRCSRSVASAAIRIKPIRPSVTAASSSANAVPRRMSALGHKRTFAVQTGMSALGPKADMCSAKGDVRFGPKADIGRVPHDAAAIMQTRSGLMVAHPRKIEDEPGSGERRSSAMSSPLAKEIEVNGVRLLDAPARWTRYFRPAQDRSLDRSRLS